MEKLLVGSLGCFVGFDKNSVQPSHWLVSKREKRYQ
jgi:hypothetical protein